MTAGGTSTLTSFDATGASVPAAFPPELTRRIQESFGTMSPWGWPMLWQLWQDSTYPGPGGFPYRGASGTTNDRAYGRDLPLFWTEVDLRGFRVLSRFLTDTNDFAIGFLGLLVGYNVRKGYGWQACRRGVKKTPYPTVGAPTDPVVARGQGVLDAFRNEQKWPIKSREAFRRWRRDGEVFGRLGSRGYKRTPWFRFVEPEQVGAPDGATSGPWAFGIEVQEYPDGSVDPEHILAYHVWDLESGMTRGEWVEAQSIVHAKANVDSTIRRGLPDFFPVQEALDGVRKLLRNMLVTAIDQAAVTWIEKYPSATQAQVGAIIPKQTNGDGTTSPVTQPPGPWPGWPGWAGLGVGGNRFRPGTVVRTEGNREFENGPVAEGVPNYVQVVQASLRGVCARWNLPEYATADASNNNFASSLVSGSPFTVTVEGTQLEWGALWEREVACRVLDIAVSAGLLTSEERAQLDVEVTEPAVVTPKPLEDAQRITSLITAGVMSKATAQQQLGLDPQHETENMRAEAPQMPADGGFGGGGNPPGGGGGGGEGGGLNDQLAAVLGEESRAVREDIGPPPFPGAVFDKTKHRWVKPPGGTVPATGAHGPQAADQLHAKNPKTGLVDHARVGVPAMVVPPPPPIPRLPGLSEKAQKVEARYAEAYEADPDKFAEKYLKALRKRKVGVEPNVFATDDAKALNPDWNPGKARPGEKLDEDTQKAMAKNNTAVHQTANAIAKRAFLKFLDSLPPDKKTVLVTNGGCAAGKGSSLARAADPDSPYSGVLPAAAHFGAVWDAAGEQNATENEWVLAECKKRGIKATFAYVYADPKETWEAPDRGVIRRAVRKGRMVDARLFADSYAEGARNMHEFHQKHKDDESASFIFLDNRKKGEPKLMDGVPEEARNWDAEEIYRNAVASLLAHKDDLPKALVKGGLAGVKIWGPPHGQA